MFWVGCHLHKYLGLWAGLPPSSCLLFSAERPLARHKAIPISNSLNASHPFKAIDDFFLRDIHSYITQLY